MTLDVTKYVWKEIDKPTEATNKKDVDIPVAKVLTIDYGRIEYPRSMDAIHLNGTPTGATSNDFGTAINAEHG